MKYHLLRCCLFLALIPLTIAELLSTGLTLRLNGVPYFVSPYVAGNVSLPREVPGDIRSALGFIPVAVLASGTPQTELADIFTSWAAVDDVFQHGFLQMILTESTKEGAFISSQVNISGAGISALVSYDSTARIPKGPYFLDRQTGNLHRAYRLYDDFAGTFNEALLAKPDNSFETLSAKVPGSATLTIGVPSRLYFEPSEAQPLAGVRVAVKDIFSLAGVKQSNGNRAWYHHYPPNNITGTALSRLIAAGAVVVGTQRLSQFATSEVATVDWVDYHSPFNPRGDGYQDPSSSSSGAGASIASYDWLDVAVGTDTGGSIRSPAGVNGVFGNRPSHSLVSLDHVMPLSAPLDTPGFLVRDLALWDKLQAVMYGKNYRSLSAVTPKYPTQIFTVDFPNTTSEASLFLNNFATSLAKYTGGSVNALNLTDRWAKAGPLLGTNTSLSTLLNVTYPVLTGKGQDYEVTGPFYADYASAHDGRRPFIDPAPLARWAWASNYSWDEAVHNKTVFMDWFNTEILPPANDTLQCSSGLILYPGKVATASPRNRYDIAPPTPFTGFSAARMSVFSECPDFIFPIGEVGNFSSLTNHVEYLPVAVGVLAAKGCDGLLSKLAMDLAEAGILRIPQVGNSMYNTTV